MRPLLTILAVGVLLAACAPGAPPQAVDPPAEPATPTPVDAEPTPEPEPSPEPTPQPEPTPPEQPAEDASLLPPVSDGPPARAVAVTEDHRVVLLDTETGEELEMLASYDDPDTFEEETGEPIAAGTFVDTVAMAPDAAHVFVAVCCEPAPGRIERHAIGGEAEQIAFGAYPAVRRDEDQIALVELQWLTIVDFDGEQVHRVEGDDPFGLARPTWSPDGTLLAFERLADPTPQLMVIDPAATTMEEAELLHAGDLPWTNPTFDRQGRLVVAEQVVGRFGEPAGPASQLVVDPVTGEAVERRALDAGVRAQAHDASGAYLVAVLGDGTARWWGPDGQEGTFGQELRHASW